jgi:hypothetical protein
MNLEDSYRNPFAEYNANKMDSKTILDYWCDPFAFKKSKAIQSGSFSEFDVLTHAMPLFFVGGRGTGKTMFLKYFSYPVQLEQAKRDIANGAISSIADYFKKKGAIGIYVRVDGPLLRSFKGKSLNQETWNSIFSHYFELRVCQAVLEVIKDLVLQEALPAECVEKDFVSEVARCLHLKTRRNLNLDSLIAVVNTDIETVTKFRSDIVFSDVGFHPRKAFSTGDLFAVIKLAKKHIKGFLGRLIFPILLDEYENFSVDQQRQINTLVKFVPEAVTFRIGMRFEGFHTFDTVTNNEFIKTGRDYQDILFEEVLIKDMDYEKFLLGVAEKRLEAVPIFHKKRFVDIQAMLGTRSDLESEARELISNRKTPDQHFKLLKASGNNIQLDKAKQLLGCPENPLLEMLNILWVIRGKSPEQVGQTMVDYLAGKKSALVAKYRMDYVDKYKLSLMFLLCSVYRQNKRYYSFNTFCFLSSGIVGNFIELCRRSFQIAYFEDRETLFAKGTIDPRIQDVAAKEASSSELKMVNRIHEYGEVLYRFVCNIGNIFRAYHTDVRLKYSETNQFSVDIGTLHDQKLKNAFNAAVEWSLVQKKPRLQSTSPNSPRRVIYTLNRIFSPAFQITYRTRGQFSEEYSEEDLRKLMFEDNVKPQVSLVDADSIGSTQQQLGLEGGSE